MRVRQPGKLKMAANMEACFKQQAEEDRVRAAEEGASPWVVERWASMAKMDDEMAAMWGELREKCEKEIVE
jgi:hypothetical protein